MTKCEMPNEAGRTMNATMKPKTSRWAVASLVLGIIGLPASVVGVGFPLAILAVILGHITLGKIKTSAVVVTGRERALVGLVLGYLAIALSTVMVFVGSKWYQDEVKAVVADRGWNIYFAQFAKDSPYGETYTNGWPKSCDFATSTAVLTYLVECGALRTDYSFFSAPGLTPYRGTNAAFFRGENNAWCVVADIRDNNSNRMPYLFTRNLKISSLAELKGRVAEQLSDEPPFGHRGATVIFTDSKAQFLAFDMLWSNVLSGQTFTNQVLRP